MRFKPLLFPRRSKSAALVMLGVGLLTACSPVVSQADKTRTSTAASTMAGQTVTAESTKTTAGTEQAKGTATPVPSATYPVELSSLKDTQVSIIHPWVDLAGEEFRRLINEFNRENVWGIEVIENRGGSVSEVARTYIQNLESSDRLDMVAISPEFLTGWNSTGYTIDLAPYITNPEWGVPEKEKNTYIKQIWEANQAGGKQIGIPAQVNLQFLVFNKTWAGELGFSDTPETRGELENQLCAAAFANNNDSKKDNDGTGGWIINASSATLLSWINSFDGDTVDAEKWIDQPATGESFTYLRELMGKGCAWNSRVASPFTYFLDRQSLSFSATLPDLIELEKALSFTKKTDEWVILPYPGEKEPAPSLMTGLSYGITKTKPANQLASWLFLRWLMLSRNQAVLAEASGSIPPTAAAGELMADFGDTHPWWKDAQKMIPGARALPASGDWRLVRPVLEDGFWQMLQPTPMGIPTLIEQMGETVRSTPEKP